MYDDQKDWCELCASFVAFYSVKNITTFAYNYMSITPNDRRRLLLILKSGDPERQLWSFVFLSNHHWGIDPHPLHFPSTLWKGEVKLPDECDQECV